MNKYRFRYYNTTFKFLSYLLVPIVNIIIVSFVINLLMRLPNSLGFHNLIPKGKLLYICQNSIIAVSVIWNIMYVFFPKGVFLYQDHLIIARYCITLRNFRFRIKVNYNDINKANVNYSNLLLSRYYGSELVPLGDNKYNVELTLKNGKKLFFSIEDAEQFCEEIEYRCDRTKNTGEHRERLQ